MKRYLAKLQPLCVLLLLCVLPSFVLAAVPLSFPFDGHRLDVSPSLQLLRGRGIEDAFGEIQQRSDFQDWNSSKTPAMLFNEIVWGRFEIDNHTNENSEIYIEVLFPYFSEIALYYQSPDGQPQHVALGKQYFYKDRPLDNSNYVFPVQLKPGPNQFYFRVYSDVATILPMRVSDATGFREYSEFRSRLLGLFIGGMLAFGGYNLFLFLAIRDRSYLYYLAMLGCSLGASLSLLGYMDQLSPNDLYWGRHSANILACAAIIFNCKFIISVLETKTSLPGFHRMFRLVMAVMLLLMLASVVKAPNINLAIIAVSLLQTILVPWSAIVRMRQGYQPAFYLLIAFGGLAAGVWLNTVLFTGWFAYNELLAWGIPLGQSMEAIMLSFALASRINLLQTAKHNSELQAQRADAENQAKGQFLAQMSHEIRTPMNGVIGMTELLSETELSSTQKHYVEVINSSSKALLTVINDILDYSKISAGKMVLENIAFDLPRLLNETALIFSLHLRNKGLQISIHYAADLPANVIGDPVRLQQILVNLISNGIKFTSQGGIRLNVLNSATAANTVRFEVVDSGIGISAAAQQKLFAAFTQADASTTRKFGGTGLGLSICKQLAALMGGEIGVVSEEGKGSTFWFTAVLPEAVALSQVSQEDAHVTTTLPALRILVAEDNSVNQLVLKGVLEKLGQQAEFVANGLEALLKMQAFHEDYDCVLMDCEMPEMDGYEATAKLRAWEQENAKQPVYIIAASAHVMEEQIQKAMAAGMDAHISKPIRQQELKKALARSASGSAH